MKLLNKWLFLCMFSTAMTLIIVALGNPLLPITSLAQFGWAWHHIPEFFSFFFLGTWLSEVKGLVSEQIDWMDVIYLILLIIASLSMLVSFTPLVVIPIATIPSLAGYLLKRWHTYGKTRRK